MKIPKGIEGDYLETKQNNLIFDVKGLLHPKERRICFIRFYPHPNGDRVRNGIRYKKIYNLNERYSFLKKKFPEYIYFSEERDLELQCVNNNDIKKIYTPRSYLSNLRKKNNLSNIEKYSKKLCDILIKRCNIPDNALGITGSPMVDLNKEDSDIDLVIYGTKTSLTFQEKLKQLLQEPNDLRRYNLEEFKSHYNWRAGGSSITYKEFLKSEQRKLHQGKFYDYDFFIRYIKSPEDWNGTFYDFKYENYGRIVIKATITDSSDSIFTPCSYKINNVKILDDKQIKKTTGKLNILEVNSFRGRFCEHAVERERVYIVGKLEKVYFKENLEYFRILLGDQVKDKMIIVNS